MKKGFSRGFAIGSPKAGRKGVAQGGRCCFSTEMTKRKSIFIFQFRPRHNSSTLPDLWSKINHVFGQFSSHLNRFLAEYLNIVSRETISSKARLLAVAGDVAIIGPSFKG